MSNLSSLAAVLLCAAPLVAQDPAHATWHADFDAAAKIARESKKNLLVDFTGSDWCGWCIKLHEEVFEHDAFLTPITKEYVLVALDFPQAEEIKAKVPNPKRNEELSQRYGVQGFPTILLVTPDGDVFGRTGYQEGGPEKYVEHLNSIAKDGRASLAKAAELQKQFDAAEGEAKIPVVEEAIKLLEASTAETIGTATFEKVARAAFELDPKNEKGLKLAAIEALLKAGKLDQDLRAIIFEMDPKNEKGLYEKLILAQVQGVNSVEKVKEALVAIEALDGMGIKDKEIAKELYVPAAFWNQRFNSDVDKAKVFAQKALDLGIEDNPALKEALESLIKG